MKYCFVFILLILFRRWSHHWSEERLGQLVFKESSHHQLPIIVSRSTTSHTRRLIPLCSRYVEGTKGIYPEDDDNSCHHLCRRQLHTSQQFGMATGETRGDGGGGSQIKPIIPGKEVSAVPPSPPPPPPQQTINPSNSPPLLPRPPRPQKKVTNFLFQKFFAFVQGYQDMMEKKFPDAMKVYRVFILGFKV